VASSLRRRRGKHAFGAAERAQQIDERSRGNTGKLQPRPSLDAGVDDHRIDKAAAKRYGFRA
jgi:hypothetical protein